MDTTSLYLIHRDFVKKNPLNLQVSNLLVTFNSSVNLLIYCIFGKKFRREMKRLFQMQTTPNEVSISLNLGVRIHSKKIFTISYQLGNLTS